MASSRHYEEHHYKVRGLQGARVVELFPTISETLTFRGVCLVLSITTAMAVLLITCILVVVDHVSVLLRSLCSVFFIDACRHAFCVDSTSMALNIVLWPRRQAPVTRKGVFSRSTSQQFDVDPGTKFILPSPRLGVPWKNTVLLSWWNAIVVV